MLDGRGCSRSFLGLVFHLAHLLVFDDFGLLLLFPVCPLTGKRGLSLPMLAFFSFFFFFPFSGSWASWASWACQRHILEACPE